MYVYICMHIWVKDLRQRLRLEVGVRVISLTSDSPLPLTPTFTPPTLAAPHLFSRRVLRDGA